MSFLAKLVLGGSEYNILNVEYDITQMLDQHNRPNGAPKGGLIQLVVESTSNIELLEWMIRPNMMKNGSIVFFRRDSSSAMKKVEFKDTFCVYLKELFISDGKMPMVTRLTLSARELIISNLSISNPWPGMKSGGNGSASSSGNSNTISSFSASD